MANDKRIVGADEPQPNPQVMELIGLFREVLAGVAGVAPTAEQRIAEIELSAKLNAEHMSKADRGAKVPEVFGNGPQISVYNPHGDANDGHHHGKPRADIIPKYPIFMFGYKVTPERQWTYDEIELLAQVRPGQYRIEKNDGTYHHFEVLGERDPDTRELLKLDIRSVSSMEGAGKQGLPRMLVILREMIAQHAERQRTPVLA